jgi:hypothetical protein
MFWAIMIQGLSACLDKLYLSEQAYLTWMSCLALQPNPHQYEIDRLLDPSRVPKSLLDRDAVLWPLDPVECRLRLQSILDRAIPAIRGMEETILKYDQASRADAETLALGSITKDEMQLLRAQRLHEQSYLQATTALLKLRKQAAAERGPAGGPTRDESALVSRPIVAPAPAPEPAPTAPERSGVCRSEQRTVNACRGRGRRFSASLPYAATSRKPSEAVETQNLVIYEVKITISDPCRGRTRSASVSPWGDQTTGVGDGNRMVDIGQVAGGRCASPGAAQNKAVESEVVGTIEG